ncbi:MAG: hypothetical protein NVS2B12_08310 [Ktedonobacteraceae bacterium]
MNKNKINFASVDARAQGIKGALFRCMPCRPTPYDLMYFVTMRALSQVGQLALFARCGNKQDFVNRSTTLKRSDCVQKHRLTING